MPIVFQRKMKIRLLQLSKCYQVRFYCKNESLSFAVVSFYKFQNVTNPKNIVQNMKPRLSHIQVMVNQNWLTKREDTALIYFNLLEWKFFSTILVAVPLKNCSVIGSINNWGFKPLSLVRIPYDTHHTPLIRYQKN